jgi:hypothetical protein
MKNADKPAFGIPKGITAMPKEWLEQNMFGINKREYFAGLAMQGLCASGQYEDKDKQLIIDGLAEDALSMADELLKQLGE